jgi:hypothetical protein
MPLLGESACMVILVYASTINADDWPMFGRDANRNAVSPEKNPPVDWAIKHSAKRTVGAKVVEEHTQDRNVLW